ncbi:MAG TPA: glycosyltransferase [Sphingobium sp.]|nr:glycosyltransferase [Sphingobium sp.]
MGQDLAGNRRQPGAVSHAARIGCVVIGRNEAERLEASLQSVRAAGLRCVYADSASQDDSVAIATALADLVVELDPATPLSAARGRNEGFAALTARWPDMDYMLFLDGDCLLKSSFPAAAARTMDERADVAVVVGKLHEKAAPDNIYSRLATLEWFSATGDIRDFGDLGGIMMVRAADFRSVGGFDPRMIAGEDSEFGVRLALADRIVTKIDCPMAEHDACITAFDQWWKRSVRAGHALAERYMKHGGAPIYDCRREFFRTIVWGIALPLAAFVPAWWTDGASLLLLLAYPLGALKVAIGSRRRGRSLSDAMLEARFSLYHKVANTIGLVKYFWRRLTGQTRIMEYKRNAIKESLS